MRCIGSLSRWQWIKALVYSVTGATLLFILPEAAPLFYPLGTLFLALAAAALQHTREDVYVAPREKGGWEWRERGQTRQLDAGEVASVAQDPSRGLLTVWTKVGLCYRFPRIHSNMRAFSVWLTPRGDEEPESNTLKFRQSRQGIGVYLIFLAIQGAVVSVVFLTPDSPAWVEYFGLLLALPALNILYRLLFTFPLWWILTPESVQSVCLFRTRTYNRARLREFRTDRYTYGDAPYFLVRFGFGRTALVLDEYALREPLYLHRAWILKHWSV